MKKKLSFLLVLSMVCTAALAGCGGKEQEPQTIDDVKEESKDEAKGEVAGEQEMTFVLNNEPDTIDPTVTNNSFATPFLVNCFEGLVTYNEEGEVVPGNAESWEANDDLTVYTFKLRDGLKWSDGSDLTAKDYVYSALRVLTPATAGQYVNMISDYVVNAEEF